MEKEKQESPKNKKKKNTDEGENVKNEVEINPNLTEAPLTLSQRKKRAMAMRRAAPRIRMGRKRAAKKMANREKLQKRSLKKARELIRAKVAGKKGKDYKNLSYGEKMAIDKQVEKRKTAIKRIAKRILPKVVRAERERLKRATGSKKMNEAISCPDIEKSNKFHRLYGDDKRLRFDRRLKMNRHEAEPFDMSEFEDIYNNIVNEQFENIVSLEEKENCDTIDQSDIKKLEKFADRLLNKFGVDIGFTTHFKERMVDPRNNPCISIDDLRYFFKKVAVDKAKRIRKTRENELVLKDIQQDLNLPVVIDIDRKGDLDITLKTVMRKKKFQTPDPIVKY